jgi:23S rRNA pseudouridine1911/1915/1917 synthase
MPAVLSTGVLEQPTNSNVKAVNSGAQTTDNFTRSILGTFLNQTAGIISTPSLEQDLDEVAEPVAESETRSVVIDTPQHGERLDRALALAANEFSRSYLQQLIEDGSVRLNAQTVRKTSLRVKAGDTIDVELRPTPQSQAFRPEAMELNVVFEDAHLLVINKPAGMVVHPAPGNWSGTLLNGLLARDPACASVPRAGIVHRLDKDTSGLMVVARTRAAMDTLVKAIAAREVSRQYMALAHRPWAGVTRQTVDKPIGRDPRNRLRMAVVDLAQTSGKTAKTDIVWLANGDGGCWVRCILHTGRTHQIRVHMASLGHPLVADTLYGGSAMGAMARQALHAYKLAFVHPVSGEPLAFESEPPSDFLELLEYWGLRYNASAGPGGF